MDERLRFVRFVLVGGGAAGVNIASRWALSFVMGYQLAIVVAYLIGMLTAFILMRIWVFEESGDGAGKELVKFAIVNGVALVQVWAVSMGLVLYILPAIGWTWEPKLVAHTIGVLSPVITSYLGHKYFSFGGSRSA
ncbi:MAG: GtrA family protein [Pseudomonadota bacterium]